ncbi:MAG TPA: FAD-dependent oxidoreductase [Burkholderiales bacterium]|nr:FAD-dependent oxidoreductase [Burkholderiales bacterium]
MKHLLLLGAGHAHALVLRALAQSRPAHLRVTLVAPHPRQLYSGMLPGLLAGHYRLDECVIELAPLAARAGAELVLASVAGLDGARRHALLEDGRSIGYDLASLNLGSLPDFAGVPGAREHALAVKPFELFVAAWQRLRAGRAPVRVAIAGAGAAGVELAMAMAHAFATDRRACEVTLYSDQPAFAPRLARRVARALARCAVALRAGVPVQAVEPGPVVIAAGERRPVDALVWSAGAAPLPWWRETGLALDGAGFVLVDATLRSVSHPEVFAAGDSASLRAAAHPKSGVYSVRHGELLARNLRRALAGRALERYVPQRRSLALLSCGERYAIGAWDGLSTEGRWLWRLKDRIDRGWIARFAL